MSPHTPSRTIPISLAILIAVTSYAMVEASPPSLAVVDPGMSHHQVRTLLGEPVERMEFESKQQELWQYKTFEVHFCDGVVCKSKGPSEKEPIDRSQTEDNSLLKEIESTLKTTDTPSVATATPVKVEDILTEIMGTTDSEPEDKKKPARRAPNKPLLLRK